MTKLYHHGAIDGVTGSCHELRLSQEEGLLIDCGLFQGNEDTLDFENQIPFRIDHIKALLVTHVHIDHVGRIPHLFAHGYKGPIYCTEATAKLLPLVLEDALKVGFTKNHTLIQKTLKFITNYLIPTPYKKWTSLPTQKNIKLRFQPAGHILGSAYLELNLQNKKRIIFSGDLGPPHMPLLPDVKPPSKADVIVLESTYGGKKHHGRETRIKKLKELLIRCFENKGLVIIPAFSIGRTQELLYELESIIFQMKSSNNRDFNWDFLDIVVDSPMANKFTHSYIEMKDLWDKEAKKKLSHHRHPLNFEQLITVHSHAEHLKIVKDMSSSDRPAIVISAGGMCNGGRIIHWLKSNIEKDITEILLVGYQSKGTTGRDLQNPKISTIELEGKSYSKKAKVFTLSSYSAHADQNDLIHFVTHTKKGNKNVVLVHGENSSRRALTKKLHEKHPSLKVMSPNKNSSKNGYEI